MGSWLKVIPECQTSKYAVRSNASNCNCLAFDGFWKYFNGHEAIYAMVSCYPRLSACYKLCLGGLFKACASETLFQN